MTHHAVLTVLARLMATAGGPTTSLLFEPSRIDGESVFITHHAVGNVLAGLRKTVAQHKTAPEIFGRIFSRHREVVR
jgi:hypothetical protein